MIRLRYISLIIAMLLLPVSGAEAEVFGSVTNERLQTECNQKTIVMNSSGDKVGENLNGFCIGYLRGFYEMLRSNQLLECKSTILSTDDFLVSIYQTYMAAHSEELKDTAATSVKSAFTSAFDCGTSADPLGILH